jgi:hypothetical protein
MAREYVNMSIRIGRDAAEVNIQIVYPQSVGYSVRDHAIYAKIKHNALLKSSSKPSFPHLVGTLRGTGPCHLCLDQVILDGSRVNVQTFLSIWWV